MSKRVTQRAEDLAYSMLGIFDIFMPFSYGDGTGAFLRLQEAIIEKTDDQSIFCWEWDHTVDSSWASVLAPSPRVFANSAKYYPKLLDKYDKYEQYCITNVGLSIELPLVQAVDPSMVLAVLEVQIREREPNDFQVGIPLRAGRVYQRMPFPFRPVPIDATVLNGGKRINVHAAQRTDDHRFRESDLAYQKTQSCLFYNDVGRAASARVGFVLVFHLDGCEVELVPTQPGVELLRSVSTVTFSDEVASGSSSFMATALKIKHTTIGEIVVLLATRKSQGSGYLFFSQSLPPNRRRTKASIDRALAKLRERSVLEHGDQSYQSGREVCVTLAGSFPFSGSGGPTVKTVQVWVNKAARSINPVQRVRAGLLGLKRTLSRS
jgi:hypothetical protein